MKALKWILGVVGLIGIIAAIAWIVVFAFDMQEIIGAAQRYDSARTIANPSITTSMIAGLAALAGLLLGLGLGLPSRTSGQIRRDALDEANAARSEAIGRRAADHATIDEPDTIAIERPGEPPVDPR